MSDYIKYQHVEKLFTDETEGLLDGVCHVFPKIDGSNGHVWIADGELRTGSRRREVSIGDDNAGFAQWCNIPENEAKLLAFLAGLPLCSHVFGEWLVKHSLVTYRDDAWRRFYVFDVLLIDGRFMSYDEWKPVADDAGIDYIPCIRKISFPTPEYLFELAEQNDFLMKPGEIGEGLVVKRYDYKSKYGRTTWGKYVRGEFKETHAKVMGGSEGSLAVPVEYKIAEEVVTPILVYKEAEKINAEEGRTQWSQKSIPRLLGTVFYCAVTEELWDALKRHKNPTIDFKRLNRAVIQKTKEAAPDLF